MQLRDYQASGISGIRAAYADGVKKVLLWMATGAGKTVIFSYVMREAALRGKRSIMVVRGRELVDQASRRLFREKVEHGVRMRGHWNRNYGAKIQICSIDTLRARDQWPKADLVVIDEADLATSESFKKLAHQYPTAFFLSVTATPYTTKSLRHVAETIVHPITVGELIHQGHLVFPKYYSTGVPDLTGIQTINNDYVTSELESRMGTITGDIVAHWQRLGEDRPTICFAVSVAHSHQIKQLFLSAGIACEHCDAETPDHMRKSILARLQSGEIKVVTNVGILGRGVDMPYVGCIVMARPTRSYNLYIQQAGRGTRTHPGKNNFILLDHAGNVPRHGFIDVEPPVDLDGTPIKEKVLEIRIKICQLCYAAYQSSDCPDCGPQEVNTKKEIEIAEGDLKELIASEQDPILQFISHAKATQKKRGYKPAWVWHQLIERFGEQASTPYLPFWFIPRKKEFGDSPFRGANE